MILHNGSALKVAEFLLQIKAIRLQPEEPFLWASGWKSPVYCDNRKTLSYPDVRTYIRQQFSAAVTEHYGNPDAIAGVATGGIAQGALVAQELGIPFIYVRSSVKKHGTGQRVEGHVEPGQSVVVIEDLVSTGGSSLNAVNALRETGCNVKGMVAVFSYGFPLSIHNFKNNKCDLVTLTDYETLITQALKSGYIASKDLASLREWHKAPEAWSETRSNDKN